jgi:GPH family glycoside/pentoside/hexuronide:cation symporter
MAFVAERVVADLSGQPVEPAAAFDHVPMRRRDKALDATGDTVDSVINWGLVTFVFYYLTAVVGLSGTEAGTVLLISTLLDAFADPFIGSLSDNTHSRWGRRLPWMFWASFPIAIGFGLALSIPGVAHGAGLIVYVTVLFLALRVAISVFTLPYGALGAELTTDYHERSVLFAWRWVFNCTGNVVIIVLGYYVFMRGAEGLLDKNGYRAFGWTCGLIAWIAMMTCCYGAWTMRHRIRPVTQAQNPGGTRFVAELREVMSNRSFWILFLCLLLFWTGQGVFTLLGVHVNLYFWRLPDEVLGILPLMGIAGFYAGIPVAAVVLQRFEKREVALAGLVTVAVIQFVPAPLQIAGVLPGGPALYRSLSLLSVIGGIAGSCALIAWGSMMADAADEHEHLFEARREGLYFAGLTLSFKAAAGLGGLLGGLALDAIGFPNDVASVGVENIPGDTILDLGIVQGPLAASLALVGTVILLGYRLDRKRILAIQSDLASRAAERSSVRG